MNLQLLKLTSTIIFNDQPSILLTTRKSLKYIDGKVTDEVEGFKYTVVVPYLNYEKVTVKILSKEPAITQEQIDKASELLVQFIDLEAKLYQNAQKDVMLSATAKEVKIVNGKN